MPRVGSRLCSCVAGSISLTVGYRPGPGPRRHARLGRNGRRTTSKRPHLAWKTPERPTDESRRRGDRGRSGGALKALATAEMTPDRWTSFLSVRVVSAGSIACAENPPLWGSYRVSGAVIRFEPRFPLEPGITYRATFDPVRLHADRADADAIRQPYDRRAARPLQADRRILATQKVGEPDHTGCPDLSH